MSRLLAIGVVGLLFVAGCGSAVGDPSAGRTGGNLFPEVTNRMRAACANWIPSDAGIAGVVNAFEADRAAGFTSQQATWSVVEVANDLFSDDPMSRAAYSICMNEIVADVW